MRILYVEDEARLASAVIHMLEREQIHVDWTGDGEEGLQLALNHDYDCLVLDIMLPHLSGVEILQAVRRHGVATPIIMLSALSEVEDKVQALESGADDYIAKPFKTSELIARIHAVTRRPPLQSSETIRFADLEYDTVNRTLNSLPLTSKEADLIEALLRQPNTVQAKEQLLARVWGSEADPADNYVEVYISYLRKKLQQLNSKVIIETIRNLGYKLTEQ